MHNLDFLRNVTLTATQTNSSSRVAHNPSNDNDFRILSDGTIIASDAMIEEFNLEFKHKDERQYGVDFIDASHWSNYPNDAERLIFIGFPSKSEPRVDAFGIGKWNEDGTPVSSTAKQRPKNTQLVDSLKEIYGENVFNRGYLDLKVARGYGITTPNGVYNVPKLVTRGESKGEMTYQRREYTSSVYPLVPDLSLDNEQELVTTYYEENKAQ